MKKIILALVFFLNCSVGYAASIQGVYGLNGEPTMANRNILVFAECTGSDVNFREDASINSEVIGIIQKYEPLYVLHPDSSIYSAEWLPVMNQEYQRGYISKKYVKTMHTRKDFTDLFRNAFETSVSFDFDTLKKMTQANSIDYEKLGDRAYGVVREHAYMLEGFTVQLHYDHHGKQNVWGVKTTHPMYQVAALQVGDTYDNETRRIITSAMNAMGWSLKRSNPNNDIWSMRINKDLCHDFMIAHEKGMITEFSWERSYHCK